MSYYTDVYQSRLNHLGYTTAERIRNGGIRSFYKWLCESPHTVRDLSVERGIFFDGIILTKTDKEYRKDMYLNVANDIPLKVGDIMNWTLDDGSIEKWLILQEEKKVNGTYRTFFIVRCNYYLKWIDGQGHRQGSWAYFVSSVDSKVKGNYRTWHNVITPQPNKYAEIIMPYYQVDRATNFIVEDESWSMIECDISSVPGTIYMSLTENKINLIYDDLNEDIADTDKEAIYKIELPEGTQTFNLGEPIQLDFSLLRNGVLQNTIPELIYSSSDLNVAKVQDGVLTAVGPGAADITVRFKDYPSAQFNAVISIEVEDNENIVLVPYIMGNDIIRLGREAVYTLMNVDDNAAVTFILDDTSLAKCIKLTALNQIKVVANAKNKLGHCKLVASYNGINYEKDIEIRSLW